MSIAEHHDEVMTALVVASRHPDAASRRAFGEAVRQDRGSQLEYVGLRFPNRRHVVRQGFSFYGLGDEGVLAVWDELWRE